MRRHRGEQGRDEILALWEAPKDVTVQELRFELAGMGLFRRTRRCTFFARHAFRRKEDRPLVERDRHNVLKRRRVWFDEQPELDPERLVFID